MAPQSSTESARIADQLRRAWEGPAWHGLSLTELLVDVVPEQALRQPSINAHRIIDIVAHLTSWQTAAERALSGHPMPRLPWEEDWPVPEPDWSLAFEKLAAASRSLIEAAAAFPDSKLIDTVPGREYNYYVLLHGIVQHNLYHAGQIALLRK